MTHDNSCQGHRPNPLRHELLPASLLTDGLHFFEFHIHPPYFFLNRPRWCQNPLNHFFHSGSLPFIRSDLFVAVGPRLHQGLAAKTRGNWSRSSMTSANSCRRPPVFFCGKFKNMWSYEDASQCRWKNLFFGDLVGDLQLCHGWFPSWDVKAWRLVVRTILVVSQVSVCVLARLSHRVHPEVNILLYGSLLMISFFHFSQPHPFSQTSETMWRLWRIRWVSCLKYLEIIKLQLGFH